MIQPTFSLVLLWFSAVHAATLPEYNLSIDANQNLGPMNPLFRDFAQGGESPDPEYLEGLIDEMRVLRPRLIRFDHALNSYLRVAPGENGNVYDFSLFDKQVSVIREMGAEPLVCLSYTPMALSPDGENTTPPGDLDAWEDLIHALVKHANADPSKRILYWEVWNEPNLEGFWSGSMEEYLELYRRTVAGCLRADADIKVGGGGFAGFPEEWIDALLDFVKQENLRLDFLSWHLYHDPPREYVRLIHLAEQKLAERGLEAETIIDEWNYSAGLEPENDNNLGAVYVSEVLRHLLDTNLDYAPFFEPKDGWTPDSEFWGRWGMFTFNEIPKANYFAFQAWSRLQDTRVLLTTDNPEIDGIATVEGSRVMAVIYNSLPEAVVARLEVSLGRSGGHMLNRWLIDKTHSNPVNGTEREFSHVERKTAFAREGLLRTRLLLPGNSVSLVELRPDPDAADVEAILDPPPFSALGSFPADLTFAFPGGDPPASLGWIESEVAGDRILPVTPAEREESVSVVRYSPVLGAHGGWRFIRMDYRTAKGNRAWDTVSYRVPPLFDVTVSPPRAALAGGSVTASLVLANHQPDPLPAAVRWISDGPLLLSSATRDLIVPASSTTRVPVTMRADGPLPGVHHVTGQVETEGGLKQSGRITVCPVLEVPYREPVERDLLLPRIPDHDRPPEGEIPVRISASWDEEFLTLRISYPDEHPVQNQEPAEMWREDSIQLSFDAGFDAQPGEGYDSNDYEYGFSLLGDRTRVYAWAAAAGRPTGEIPDIQAGIERQDDLTIYRLRIPWDALKPFASIPDTAFGFSLLINDHDGNERFHSPFAGDISGKKEPDTFWAMVLRK